MQASSQLASADVAGGRGRRRRPASASRGRAARPRAAAVNTNGARAAGAGGGRGRATRGAHTGTVTRIDMFQPILATRDEEEARGGSSWRRAPPLHSTSQAKSVGLASGLPEANGRAVRQPSAYAGGVKGRMVGGRRAVARGSGDPDVSGTGPATHLSRWQAELAQVEGEIDRLLEERRAERGLERAELRAMITGSGGGRMKSDGLSPTTPSRATNGVPSARGRPAGAVRQRTPARGRPGRSGAVPVTVTQHSDVGQRRARRRPASRRRPRSAIVSAETRAAYQAPRGPLTPLQVVNGTSRIAPALASGDVVSGSRRGNHSGRVGARQHRLISRRPGVEAGRPRLRSRSRKARPSVGGSRSRMRQLQQQVARDEAATRIQAVARGCAGRRAASSRRQAVAEEAKPAVEQQAEVDEEGDEEDDEWGMGFFAARLAISDDEEEETQKARELAEDPNLDFDLDTACKKGALAVVKRHVDEGADLGVVDGHGNYALYWACLCGHIDIVRFLLSRGARDLDGRCYDNALNTDIRAVLRVARDEAATRIQALARGSAGRRAARSRREAAAQLGKAGEQQVEVDEEGDEDDEWGMGFFAAGLAISDDEEEETKKARDLVEDPNLDFDLDTACKKGALTVVQRHVNEGADFSVVDDHGNYALYWACLCGHIDIVRFLLSRGACDLDGRCYDNALNTDIRAVLRPSPQRPRKTVARDADLKKSAKDVTGPASATSSKVSGIVPELDASWSGVVSETSTAVDLSDDGL